MVIMLRGSDNNVMILQNFYVKLMVLYKVLLVIIVQVNDVKIYLYDDIYMIEIVYCDIVIMWLIKISLLFQLIGNMKGYY